MKKKGKEGEIEEVEEPEEETKGKSKKKTKKPKKMITESGKEVKVIDDEELLNDYNNIIKKQKGISPYKTFNLKEKIKHSLKMKKSANLDKSNNINLSNLVLSNEEKLNYNSDYLSGDEDLELNIKDIKEKNNALNSSNIKRKRRRDRKKSG